MDKKPLERVVKLARQLSPEDRLQLIQDLVELPDSHIKQVQMPGKKPLSKRLEEGQEIRFKGSAKVENGEVVYILDDREVFRAIFHSDIYERKEKRSFTPEQLRALTQHVPPENRLIVETAGVLGLRSGEVLALQWGDIFGELEVEGTLYSLMHLRRSIWRGQVKLRLKTKKSRGAMPLPPELFDRLNRHKEASAWTGDQDFIFCRADGRPLDPDRFRRQVFHPAMDAAGIERVPRGDGLHALRHSAGTILYLMTRDLEKVKTFLRHTRIGTTSDIYVHPGLVPSAEAVEAMASVYFDVAEVGGVQ